MRASAFLWQSDFTLDQLLDGRDPKEVFNNDDLFDELKKALAERVLNAEIDAHLMASRRGQEEPWQRLFEQEGDH